ncbi:MAG TPA: CDP-diacylglycerol--glycerol-3-phosphate 3-phosphatidyltransferase [Planctomycetaceae bacterium]|jgi:CDP-diacylglycerol--glycerol-3-phosphate 3-phosphatidyltransferase|nr:CDP-diacylglycerol--glycerol-3-phosphate 3-phosphatidyltransferase [Planctomycetaceae bacterium]
MTISTTNVSERNLNLPNIITFARLALSFVLFGMMSAGVAWVWSAGLFVFAVLTDILDGYIARKYQLITQLGRIMDPFVDKFITAGVFLFLLPYPQSGVNAWMVIAVLGREMLVTSLRGFLEQRGADFSASASGKLKMFLQCVAATLALLTMDPVLAKASVGPGTLVLLRDISLWVMVFVTLWSGVVYIRRGIEIMRKIG